MINLAYAIFPASNPEIHRAARADHNDFDRPNHVVHRAIPRVLVNMTGRRPIRSLRTLAYKESFSRDLTSTHLTILPSGRLKRAVKQQTCYPIKNI